MTKRDEEAFYVHEFVKRIPGLRIVAQRERPDFILADSEGECALEATRVFPDAQPGRGSAAGKGESDRAEFLRRAAAHYYARGGLPVRVQAVHLDRIDLDLEWFAERLRRARPANPGSESEIELCPNDEPDLPPFAKLCLKALPADYPRKDWWLVAGDSVGLVGKLDAHTLAWRIEAKAKNLPVYRRAAPRVALLLYADAMKTSGMVRWPVGAEPPPAHAFDAVYLYLHPDGATRLA